MKYYVIAGEASGDLHGSNFLKALHQKDSQANIRAWGGDLMKAQGATLVKHYRDLAFMGFWEVLKNIRTILNNIEFCKQDILNYQPDALVLIDYPGFNLRIAKWAKTQGIKVLYYISPQIWAWRSSRAHKIKAAVDEMYVILPFEQAFYQQYNMEVTFVGHPLLDVTQNYQATPLPLPTPKPVIALLPGSRKQEIEKMLTTMLSVVPQFPDYQFVIAAAPSITDDFYQNLLHRHPNAKQVHLVYNQTYDLLAQAKAALVTSGTATLETALFGVPQIICYKGSRISYHIAKRLVNVKYIGLANLIMDKPMIPELIQHDFNTKKLTATLKQLLESTSFTTMKADYKLLHKKLGNQGASEKVARLVYETVVR